MRILTRLLTALNFLSQEELDAGDEEARLRLLAGKLLCSDVRPRDFSPLVCDMPILKNPVPRDMPGVRILSGPDAYRLLRERFTSTKVTEVITIFTPRLPS